MHRRRAIRQNSGGEEFQREKSSRNDKANPIGSVLLP